jgi:coproporphyrinogen III oxidase
MGFGVGGFLKTGRLFEKAGVHVSTSKGVFSPEVAATMPGANADGSYAATSISLIVHPRSPHVPTVHANLRYFSTTEYWFGGGADLTPMVAGQRRRDSQEAVVFHNAMRTACEPFDPEWHAKYSDWCDRYFFLPHRGQARGVGGLFFDHHNSSDFDRDLAFSDSVMNAFCRAYDEIVRTRMAQTWTDEELGEQARTRSLYVEFNLLYDRGTMFGFKVGANIDTLLSSMPPTAAWP